MFLLVIILNDPGSVNLILSKFLEIDVRGATVFNTHGMGQILSGNIPMFYSLRKFISGADRTEENFTIMSVIRTEETLKKAIREIQNELNIEEVGQGFMFVMPVLDVQGLANPLKKNTDDNE